MAFFATVQRFLLPPPGFPYPLYFREESIPSTLPAVVTDRTIALANCGVVSFESLANSFHEVYWKHATIASRVRLIISTQGGPGWIRLCRRTGNGDCITLGIQHVEGSSESIALETIIPETGAGLLFFEAGCSSGTLRIIEGTWSVEVPDDTISPTVSVAICTFNNAAAVGKLLGSIQSDRFLADQVDTIMLVSQGDDRGELESRIFQLEDGFREKVTIVSQGNLGGSGGFCRAIYELKKRGSAYCCLMDDDVEIEPDCLSRALWFAKLAKSDVCVGGQLLELERKTSIFESGNKVSLDGLCVLNEFGGLDAALSSVQERFLSVAQVDYNGWWFCLFPMTAVNPLGLPYPFFLHGDDVEWGLRLQRFGINTITLPGVYTWHPSPLLRSNSWMPYYDVRNFLIIETIYTEHFRALRSLSPLLKRLTDQLLVHDYGQAALIIRAVVDFLGGSSVLKADPSLTHQEITALFKKFNSGVDRPRRKIALSSSPIKPRRISTKLRLLTSLILPVQAQPVHWPVLRPAERAPIFVRSKDHYVLDLGGADLVHAYSRSRLRLWTSIFAIFKMSVLMILRGDKAARSWKTSIAEFSGSAYWECQFERFSRASVRNGN